MTAGFGGSGYTNPQTRALNSIANGGPADTTSQEKMAELLQRHSAQLRYLAANQKQLQKGINEATANPIEQLQQFVADIIVLLGGGELAKGALDFGDLQYILPALGALFGFGDGPFPISLFEAASKFFFGYVVPQEQFVDVINNIITAWAGVFGIDPEFVADVRDLLTAVGNLFGGLGNLLPSLQQLFDALGINGADLGPLGQVLAPIIQLFAGIDLTKFGDFIEFITDAISPVIQQLTAVINFINGVVAVLGYDGGDVVNSPLPALLQPFENLISFLANINLFGDDFNPAAAVEQFVNAMLLPLNLLLGPNSPLNALNIFGRISLPQFGGGVPIMALTTAVPNELEPFTATSVPTSDGWSYNAAEDAAQVICDGSLKTLYLRSGVIKVEEGQPLDTSIEVKYSGITSGAGQTIRYVLETFTTDNGSGTPTPVIVGAVTNPSGTITTSVTLGDASWDIPTGVKSVRPALVADESITAGTVYWKNIPELYKKLDPVFAGGLPAVLNNLGDWIETLVDQLLGALGLPALGSLFDKIMDLGDEIEGWFDDTLNTASDLAGLIGDLLSNPASVIGTLTQSMVSGLGDLNTLVNQIRDILAGLVVTPINSTVQAIKDWFSGLTGKTSGLNSSGQMNGTNIIGTIASNVVEGLDDIGDGLHDTWNKFWDGIFKTTGSTGKTAADVQTAAASVSTTAAIAQESTATLANLMNAPKNVPFWVSSNPFEDVVFPRVMASEAKIFTGGRLYLTALRTTQNRIYNQVGFMTNGGDPQENVFVAVYRIDPANGTYTLEYNFGNVSSQILTGSGLVDQRFNMPYDLQASEGDLWAVGVLTTGAGSYPGLVCVASSAMDYTGLHPRYATGYLAAQTSIPSSVPSANVSRSADRIWASLGQALDFEVPPVQLAEQFSTGQWGSSAWYLFGSGDYDDRTGVIAADGGLHMRVTPGYSLPIPKTINRSSGIHKTAMSTNDMASEVTIARVPDTSVAPIWVIVRARSNSTLGAALEITTNQARIITFDAAADPTPTARATASTTVSVGDTFRIEAVGTVYTAYRNGVPIPGCTWTDTGNAVIPIVASLRRTGWLVSFNAGFSSQDHSAWIATWRGYDLA